MNHLAHLFLAQSNTDLMVGNFIADQVKGKQLLDYSTQIQKGIKMHRAIDHFTDNHDIVMNSKERLFSKYHKYAAVIVDMYYDHILARNWKDFSPISLKQFASSAYQVLVAKSNQFPERSQRILKYMSKDDWLSNYAHIDGIDKALKGLAYRATFNSKMEEASHELELDYELYKADFNAFFPDLLNHIQPWLVDLD